MFNRITGVEFKENLIVVVTFQSGEVKEYDFKGLFSSYPSFRRLMDEPELFKRGYVAPGGCGLIFDDELDIACEELYYNGTLIDDEDSQDIKLMDLALKEYEKNPKTYTIDEVLKELK